MKLEDISAEEGLFDKWLRVNQYTFKQEGQEDYRTNIVVVKSNAVGVLPYDPKHGTVLLLKQFRMPAYLNDIGNNGGVLYEICAGHVDSGEMALEAVKREAEEELGYRLRNVQKVFSSYASPGWTTEHMDFYVAEYDTFDKVSEGGGLAHEGEVVEVVEMPLIRAFAMVLNGQIVDGKTIQLIMFLQIEETTKNEVQG